MFDNGMQSQAMHAIASASYEGSICFSSSYYSLHSFVYHNVSILTSGKMEEIYGLRVSLVNMLTSTLRPNFSFRSLMKAVRSSTWNEWRA